MEKPAMPKAGWGILSPDEELTSETIALLAKVSALPRGQQDAILARGVQRFLQVEMDLGDNPDPNKSQMVLCTHALSNAFFDFLGHH